MSILKVDEIQDAAGKKIVQNTGSILQIKQNTSGTNGSTTSTSAYSDIDPSVSITPTSSSNKILVIATISSESMGSGSDRGINLRLMRGTTELTVQQYEHYSSSDTAQRIGLSTFVWLDSPATTSSTTYKCQFKSYGSSSTARVNYYGETSVTVMEISA
jgi:hypothetical protein